MNDEFETHLSQQSLKAIPKGWRREILSGLDDKTGNAAKPISPFKSILKAFSQRPKLALCAIWILIAILNFTGPNSLKTKALAKQNERTTPTPELIAAIEREFFKSKSRSEENSPRDDRQHAPNQPPPGPRSQLPPSTKRATTQV